MKLTSSRFLVFAIVVTLFIAQAYAQVVEIPDPNLKRTIRESLQLPAEILLTQPEMLRLKNLNAEDRAIVNLTGLEHATFLTHLSLSRNKIVDISPLMNLTNLQDIKLNGNQITNISPLAGLVHSEGLGLNGNQIVDISPLMNLTNLRGMELSANQIHDLGPLAGLIYLEYLGLNRNPISDISPLANLTNLKTLYLSGGKLISDITSLANLTQLMRLRISGQSISDITPLTNLTQLIHLHLDGNQIRDISSLANLPLLEELVLNDNAIIDIAPLGRLKNLKQLWLADNPIHDFSPLLELKSVELDIEIDLSQLDELNTVVEIPDANLEQAIRQTLALPENIPFTQGQMQTLTRLSAWNSGIADLTGLEYAPSLQVASFPRNQIQDLSPLAGLIHLRLLALDGNPVSDISPLANLTNLRHLRLAGERRISDITPLANLIQLEHLNLSGQAISDITPLANLTQLIHLNLVKNYILDFTPLAKLINLEELLITQNPSTDFSRLQGLNVTKFSYDEVCEIPPLLPPVRERIANRSFPSIVQAWDDVVGLDHLTWEQRNVFHDLYWTTLFDSALEWDTTETEPNPGVATRMAGDLAHALEVRQRKLDQNPNMVFLIVVQIHAHTTPEAFPPNSDFWLRDENGGIIRNPDGEFLINFLKPKVQDLLAKRIIAVARCGLYDGVMLDRFNNHGVGSARRRWFHLATDEEIIQAYLNIFRAVRAQVREDFLILINANRSKATYYAKYVNGTFMETLTDNLGGLPGGYTRKGLAEIESTLLWSEENFRSPQINCLEGWGIPAESPDSSENRRWMRVFTTMSLTLSDGYTLYNKGNRLEPDHTHIWYPFWDADLGQPVGPKAQPYENIDGTFIREFTNGWAVYNRSGTAQTITLPAPATPVSDRGNSAASQIHLLPDLDGEIYLKSKSSADVNGDGNVNILDLVQVANGLGKSEPDLNGDGAVNILDLVFVAQQFNE